MIRPILAALVLIATASPAAADGTQPPEIVFPVIGDVNYTDTFGAPRDGGERSHEGTDIMTNDAKGLPVLAAAAGTISWVDDECCHLAIDHPDGWSTWYIHLNNDTPGTDDGQGWGIAPGITEGVTVAQGQLIGWVGDSGNAENAGAQLHFEIRQDGTAINPYPSLTAAPVLSEPGDLPPPSGDYFIDDNTSVHETDIDRMFELGITKGCNPPTNDRYCPTASVTRDWLVFSNRRTRRRLQFDEHDSPRHRRRGDRGTAADVEAAGVAERGASGCSPAADATSFSPCAATSSPTGRPPEHLTNT